MPHLSPDFPAEDCDTVTLYGGYCDDVDCSGVLDGVANSAAYLLVDRESEPLLTATSSASLCSQFPELWNLYKHGWTLLVYVVFVTKFSAAARMCMSVATVDPAGDCRDWDENLDDAERNVLAYTLVSLAASKAVEFEYLATHFVSYIKLEPARRFYGIQLASAGVHLDAFSRFSRLLIRGAAGRAFYFNATANVPFVRCRAQWVTRWLDSRDTPFRVRLVAFLAAKAIFFSGTYFILSWFDQRAFLPSLCLTGEVVARDESVGIDFACRLYHLLGVKPCEHVVQRVISAAAVVEKGYIRDLIAESGFGLDADQITSYVDYVADRLFVAMGYSPGLPLTTPPAFAVLRPLRGSAGFFERKDLV